MNPAVSVILPSFRKFSSFCRTIPHNGWFQDERVEVLLVLDDPDEQELYLGLIKGFWGNHVKFRLIVNEQDHDWRPPCKAINVGIRHSMGDYIVVMSPESVLLTPRPQFLWELLHVEKWRKFFVTGLVGEISKEDLTRTFSLDYYSKIVEGPTRDEFGFLLAAKGDLVDIGGYDERRVGYGGDDDQIRDRLQRHGIKHVNCSQLRVAHLRHEEAYKKEGSFTEPWKDSEIIMPNQRTFGTDFASVKYCWTKI